MPPSQQCLKKFLEKWKSCEHQVNNHQSCAISNVQNKSEPHFFIVPIRFLFCLTKDEWTENSTSLRSDWKMKVGWNSKLFDSNVVRNRNFDLPLTYKAFYIGLELGIWNSGCQSLLNPTILRLNSKYSLTVSFNFIILFP